MRTALASPLALLLCLAPACGDDRDDGAADTSGPGSTATTDAPDPDGTATSAETTEATAEPTTETTAEPTGASDPTTTAGPATTTTSDTGTADPDTGATTEDDTGDTGAAQELPPIDSVESLEAWLAQGSYKSWAVESAVHASTGPHGGNVRTYVNAVALASLGTDAAEHPQDTATVKELYGASLDEITGYAVMLKTAPTSQGGATWYWYERLGGTLYASDLGVGLCTGCHGGPGSHDYILTPYPLQ